MQSLRGERFFVPLDDHVQAAESIERKASGALPGALVSDVLERPTTATVLPPAPPKVKATSTGFPEHRKRTRQSAFKQRRDGSNGAGGSDGNSGSNIDPQGNRDAVAPALTPKPHDRQSFEQADRLRIDQENRDRLSNMSPEAIERERAELFAGLSPALIQRLLKRSTIEDQQEPTTPRKAEEARAGTGKNVSFANAHESVEDTTAPQADGSDHDRDTFSSKVDEAGPPEPVGYAAITTNQLPSIHFPQPPEPPDLDPRSESFLADLHEKYFPNLSHDPAKLSWMQPSSSSDNDDSASAYHPSQLSLAPTELRFDFKGSLLPPNLSRQIPVTKGLHHHGDAPEAAGYTIPELAHLARSSNASQRCIAFQTAGRILYRLGVGDFGREDDELDEIAALSRGLWDAVEESGIIQIMAVEAGRERGHLSARAYAQEALWNWRRGGGRKKRAQ